MRTNKIKGEIKMRFREIRTSEKITDNCVKKEESKNYTKIKPKTGLTVEEATVFLDSLFNSVEEES